MDLGYPVLVTTSNKSAKAATRNSNQYEHNFKENFDELPDLDKNTIKKKHQACDEKLETWITRITQISQTLPNAEPTFITVDCISIEGKSEMSNDITKHLRDKLAAKSYLLGMVDTASFKEWYGKLATISEDLHPSFQYLASLRKEEVKKMEVILQFIHQHIFTYLLDHLNQAIDKPQRNSLEMALYWADKTNLLKKARQELPTGPWENENLLYVLHQSCRDLQIGLFKDFFRQQQLSKLESTTTKTIEDLKSEFQRFVGWAIRSMKDVEVGKLATLRKKRSLDSVELTDSAKILRCLRKMSVFDEDVRNCKEYKSYYQVSERILNKGGLTLVDKELFEWARELLLFINKNLNKKTLAVYKEQSIQLAYDLLTGNEKLQSKFESALGRLSLDIDNKLMLDLHKRLVTKVFHAQTKAEVNEYKKFKLNLLKANEKSKLNFRSNLLADSERRKAQKGKKRPDPKNAFSQKKQRIV